MSDYSMRDNEAFAEYGCLEYELTSYQRGTLTSYNGSGINTLKRKKKLGDSKERKS